MNRTRLFALIFMVLTIAASNTHAQSVSFEEESQPSPDGERALLLGTGALVGLPSALLGSILVGSIAYGSQADGYAPLYATVVAAPLTALLTVPAGVFLFGNLSGRGADFGWTLLGGVVGSLPGAGLLAMSFVADSAEATTPLLISGAVIAGVGLIAGSIIGFELSSDSGPPVELAVGLGTLSISGRF